MSHLVWSRRIWQVECRRHGYNAFSCRADQVRVHHSPNDSAHAYAASSTSSRMRASGVVPIVDNVKCIQYTRHNSNLCCNLFPECHHVKPSLRPRSGQSISHRTTHNHTNLLYSMNLVKNRTSSRVNATPFPVVLLYNALGGVGDRLRVDEEPICCPEFMCIPSEPPCSISSSSSTSGSPFAGDSERSAFITYPPRRI